MMSVCSTVLIYYNEFQFGKYALGLTLLICFTKLYIITTYPVDFIIGVGLGLLVGGILILFHLKKKKEYEEILDLSDKFHF